MPQRIQRKRTKGWRMPQGAVYVGRPTKFGNPFPAIIQTRRIAVARFKDWMPEGLREQVKAELKGKDLACWCPLTDRHGLTVPCHADVLLEIANA